MLKLRFTNSFKKDYRLLKKRGYDLNLLDEVVETLLKGEELDKKYKDHILLGKKYKGLHECHILQNWLLVYRIIENELILELCYSGTHSDLF